MAPLADFLLSHVPLPLLPHYLTHYVQGQTPLSTPNAVFSALATYIALIFGLRQIMSTQQPLKLHVLSQLHNLVLSLGSGVLLTLILEEILPILWRHGLFHAICNDDSWTRPLEFYYIINYYIKYLELLDTIFLVLKKKPLTFLHVFHHSATALLCYTQLNGKTSISWVPITLNLMVHVLMYYYYYACAGGARVWWKRHVTTMQIVQFIIDLVVVYFGTYSYYVAVYFSDILPTYGKCAGTETAAVFGCALLTSYLFLFINFYVQTYKKPVRGGAVRGKRSGADAGVGVGGKVANGNALSNGNALTNGNALANGNALTNGNALANGNAANGDASHHRGQNGHAAKN